MVEISNFVRILKLRRHVFAQSSTPVSSHVKAHANNFKIFQTVVLKKGYKSNSTKKHHYCSLNLIQWKFQDFTKFPPYFQMWTKYLQTILLHKSYSVCLLVTFFTLSNADPSNVWVCALEGASNSYLSFGWGRGSHCLSVEGTKDQVKWVRIQSQNLDLSPIRKKNKFQKVSPPAAKLCHILVIWMLTVKYGKRKHVQRAGHFKLEEQI